MNREEFSIRKLEKSYLIQIVSENELDTKIININNIHDHDNLESSRIINLQYY